MKQTGALDAVATSVSLGSARQRVAVVGEPRVGRAARANSD